MTLRGFQRQHLKALAHSLRPVVQLGKDGLSPALIAQVDEALTTHELIKVRLSRPEDKKALAQELAKQSSATLVALLGHTVTLYRPHPTEPKIRVPERDAGGTPEGDPEPR